MPSLLLALECNNEQEQSWFPSSGNLWSRGGGRTSITDSLPDRWTATIPLGVTGMKRRFRVLVRELVSPRGLL